MPKANREAALVQLEKANDIRLGRAALCRRIRTGELALPDVIDPDVELEDREEIERLIHNMQLEKVICAVDRVGRARFERLWQGFELPPKEGVRFRELHGRRRVQLAAHLRAKKIGVRRSVTA